MARRLEELEMKKIQEVQAISEIPVQAMSCSICQSFEHLVEEYPTIPVVREMFGDQANVIGQFKPNNNALYGNTYNSNWRNHPNFSWKPRTPITLNKMMDGIQNDLSQKIDNLQYSISRLTNLNTMQEKGKFPSQPHQNPKEGLNVNKKVFLTEEVSAFIQCKSPVKYKDPSCPTISVMIGETWSGESFVGLGGKYRSVKIPRGIIENVLVQVDKFYYPVDLLFLIRNLVAKGTNYVPIILGRPFRATSNAIINCRNGVMQLTFGNMTLELNIFYLCKKQFHSEEEERPEEVYMIDNFSGGAL
ncbi:hypothetical protein CK203_100690 [Vitis vinifera]|uniref:Uncharacterized protein n=1 Tax=Vitis vinifera TaxID=29760 RepID=A0A438FI27_VITVI|nr:hypothetical protein CK203_100690 [Vitis vinifera]